VIESQIKQMSEVRRRAVAPLSLFDASLWLGRPEGFPLAEEMDTAALTHAMGDYGIRGGLVSELARQDNLPAGRQRGS